MDEYGRYAYQAGFRGLGLSTAIAVGYAETRGNPDQTGKVGELGPWQIYPKAHPDWASGGNLRDYAYNAKAAYAISSQGTNWRLWTTWPAISGIYQIQATVAAQRIEKLGGIGALPAEAQTHVPGLGSGAENIGQSGLSALTALPEAFNRIGQWISTPANWTRVAQVAVGGILLLLALSAISKPVTEPIVKTVGAIK